LQHTIFLIFKSHSFKKELIVGEKCYNQVNWPLMGAKKGQGFYWDRSFTVARSYFFVASLGSDGFWDYGVNNSDEFLKDIYYI